MYFIAHQLHVNTVMYRYDMRKYDYRRDFSEYESRTYIIYVLYKCIYCRAKNVFSTCSLCMSNCACVYLYRIVLCTSSGRPLIVRINYICIYNTYMYSNSESLVIFFFNLIISIVQCSNGWSDSGTYDIATNWLKREHAEN